MNRFESTFYTLHHGPLVLVTPLAPTPTDDEIVAGFRAAGVTIGD
jgi:hypothetical protein